MGIIRTIKSAWNAASTTEKINLVLDIVCGFGAGAISGRLMKKMAPDLNPIERVCASVAMCGLGMAAGEAAKNAYGDYTKALGTVIDKAKEKKDKEEEANG